MVSIRDVARAAGVSTATVSHVVNGTRKVSPATEGRVRQAIQELGYRQNLAARGLKTKSTQTIGMVVPNVMNHYFGSVALGVEMAMAAEGYLVSICNTAGDEGLERAHIASLVRHRVDGIILGPTVSSSALDEIVRWRIPTVLLDRESEHGLPSVRSENHRSVAEAVRHLRSNGYPVVAALVVGRLTPSVEARLRGYEEAVASAHAPMAIRLDSADGRGLLGAACAANHGAIGLIPANYQALVATLSTMRELGLRVCVDAGLISFDDFEWAGLVEPAISCMRQRVDETVLALTQSLAAVLAGEAKPADCEIPPEMVVRDSSGRRD